ncbi:MAG: hypothetical protein JWN98_1097 [Abditibacteriota bacterium]|nr:hypothetical protein [Abditibacteriota bacterium]
MGAFFVTSGSAWPVPVLAMVILWSRFIEWRFARESFAPWILRLITFAAIGLTAGVRPALAADWLMDARTVNIIGLIAVAEMTLQFWRATTRHTYQPSIVLLAGIVLLIASNTFDPRYIRFFAPPFILFAVFALRDLQPRVALQSTLMPGGLMLRIASLSVVLGGGFAMHTALDLYRGELMSLGLQFLHERRFPQSIGVSMQPRLSSRFNATASPQRVLRIVGNLHDPHLRAAAFDLYAGGSWGPAINARKPHLLPETAPPSSSKEHSPARITRLIDIEGALLFAPLNAAAVVPGEASSLEYDAANAGPLRSDEPAPYEYTVWESTRRVEGIPVFQGPLCAPLQAADRARYLQVPPEVDPRVRALAEQITRDTWHPAERARAIVEYLMANHKYSGEARRGGGDPISNFLLGRRAAHCEYFGSAAVILLRSVGVPSRYVVGYLAHEKDGPETTIVRQRDAHAWAEAWIDGVGWVSVDATPGDGRPNAQAPIPWWRKVWERAQDAVAALREQVAHVSRGQWTLLLCALVIVWAATRLRLAHRKVLGAVSDSYTPPEKRLCEVATRFESWLAQQQNAPPATVSWRRFLQHAECELPNTQRAAALEFAKEYERVRWGQSGDEEALQSVDDLMNRLELYTQPPSSAGPRMRRLS